MDAAEILLIMFSGIWLMFPADLPNSGAAFFGGGKPMDFGKTLSDGTRILGDGKTWRGCIAGVVVGFVVGLIQIGMFYPFDSYPLGNYGDTPCWIVVLLCLSAGAIFGDLLGSFIKRRLKVKRGAKFPILDQYDFVIGSWLFLALFAPVWLYEHYLEGERILATVSMLIGTPLLHRATNIIGYRMGKKKEPW